MAVCSTTTFCKCLSQLSHFGQPLRKEVIGTPRGHAIGETLTTSGPSCGPLFESGEPWLGEVHRGPRHARFLKALGGTLPVAGCGRWAEKLVYLSGWFKFRFSRRSGEPAPGLSAKAPPHR